MNHSRILGLVLFIFAVCVPARGAEYYVAPGGDDGAAGTLAAPFASLARAQRAAAPGDTVWLRGGVYAFSGTTIATGVVLDKSGAPGRPINYFAYRDERPVFDFFKLLTRARIRGFSVTGDWIHLRGIEVRGVQQILTNVHESWAIRVEGGSHNIFERLDLHDNEGPGLFIAEGSDNLVLNCDSHDNYDADRGGENADGFGGHGRGRGNIFRGCRAWNNSDDGFDLIHARGADTIEHCWAWHNGYVKGTSRRAGNGGGFKCGGFLLDPAKFPPDVPTHTIRFNLAFDNRAIGFNANYHPARLLFYNNTAFGNPANFDMKTVVPTTHTLRNNVAYGPGHALTGTGQARPDSAFNSWDLNLKLTDADFESVVPEGMDGPRQADGSLPEVKFMHPAPGSKLIDAGTDVGLPYSGKAPDLGAFEFRD